MDVIPLLTRLGVPTGILDRGELSVRSPIDASVLAHLAPTSPAEAGEVQREDDRELWKHHYRRKMKRKMKQRYAPVQREPVDVFEQYRYRNPRKALKGMLRQASLTTSMGATDSTPGWLFNLD